MFADQVSNYMKSKSMYRYKVVGLHPTCVDLGLCFVKTAFEK